ncbi:MAG: glycosyltransferase family 4 protein [bacterium]|nr:glycosyltransferase family 4 protein [bacterium]
MHVLHKNRSSTGSVVQMVEAARGQRDLGYPVAIASRPGGDLEQVCRDNGLRFVPLAFRHEFDLGTVRALRREMVAGCDVIHVHKGLPHSLCLIAAVGLGRLPRLVVNRGVSFPLTLTNKWKYRHPRVGCVVCVAQSVRDVVIQSAQLAPERVRVIHAGTDIERFNPRQVDPVAVRRELDIASDAVLIGTVSVRDWKGWRELLHAFASVAGQVTNARLLIVGCESSEEASRVEREVAQVGLLNRVNVLPCRSDMPDVLAACDIVVDASWAGTGITGTVREAMALERAVIATDVGGNRELIDSVEVGRLVPPRDIDALVQGIVELATSPNLHQAMGKAARQRVVEGFSTRTRVEQLLEVYDHVVSEHGFRN